MPAPTLAEAFRLQERIHFRRERRVEFASFRALRESHHGGLRRRQADDVKVKPSHQRNWLGVARGREFFFLQLREDEAVEVALGPDGVFHSRWLMLNRFLVGPELTARLQVHWRTLGGLAGW